MVLNLFSKRAKLKTFISVSPRKCWKPKEITKSITARIQVGLALPSIITAVPYFYFNLNFAHFFN